MTERYAVIMYDTETHGARTYDVFTGPDAQVAAINLGINECTRTRRPIVLDVNALIAEAAITPAELAEIAAG